MSEITVTSLEDGRYAVRVRQGTATTNHTVTVPQELVEELGLHGVDGCAIVEASFAFLLEREPATSILADFPLDVIARYFPEFDAELPGRLGV